ncbi:Alpha/Beta hydrolase protein [Mycena maculata]|uniref:Carboxylic ester hydrolase n=1 Tax=Mycena maculata TaxID=230809 RepID=A0AAD7ICQ5_9AGAR|nr:Alpha/Beta hydrolase protein [Mycena maculata]
MFVAAGVVLCARAQSPIVDLGYAQYQGTVSPANISHFLGIRYAAAPLGLSILEGDFRFRAPQPPTNATASINGVDANGLTPTNPLETRAAAEVVISTEDCLFFNVYYPSDTAGTPVEDLPVLLWIHGGGYVAGRASLYDGEDDIYQSNRGIVVIIQYRLGVFGFLPGAEVKKNGALNAGRDPSVDQDFALRCINKYIAKFGGGPARVTIWGESAGAGSVLQHIVANNGKTQPQLFRGAITSSTFLSSQYEYNDRIPELLYGEVVVCTSATDAFSCLQTVNATVLETANTQITISGFYGTYLFVDGFFITQRPTVSLLQGAVNGVSSSTRTSFVNQSTGDTANATQYALDLFPSFGPVQADKVGSLYAGLGTQLFQENAIIGESTLICPTYYLLRAFHGRAFKVGDPELHGFAEFAIPPGLHSCDVPYYFPSTATPLFQNTSFINAFAQSSTSFGISLNPNVKIDPTTITPPWKEWEVGHTEMLFNETAAGRRLVEPLQTSDALLERCQCVSSIHPCAVARF